MIDLKKILYSYELDLQSFQNIKDSGKKEIATTLKNEKLEGIVFEKAFPSFPLIVCVLLEKKHSVLVSLMSYAYELATHHDFFVKFEHPIRDLWIVETDLIYELPKNKLFQYFIPVGNLSESDVAVLKNFLKGHKLPSERIGYGTLIDEKIKFKKIEKDRARELFAMGLEYLAEMEKEMAQPVGVAEPENDVIKLSFTEVLSDFVRKSGKRLKEIIYEFYEKNGLPQPALAATQIGHVFVEDNTFIFKRELKELNIIFAKEFIGQPVDIVLSINKSEFPLFSLKKAPHMITISLPEDDLLALALAYGELKVKKRI